MHALETGRYHCSGITVLNKWVVCCRSEWTNGTRRGTGVNDQIVDIRLQRWAERHVSASVVSFRTDDVHACRQIDQGLRTHQRLCYKPTSLLCIRLHEHTYIISYQTARRASHKAGTCSRALMLAVTHEARHITRRHTAREHIVRQ
jgi:hypothetical protein